MKATFRNPAAREAAWGRYYRRKGLAPIRKHPRCMPNVYRIANYLRRKAEHEAEKIVCSEIVKF